ncbi:uncharacterized protein [Venturia canescens]|nr:uncharacterized protein LOC122412453 isoform X2 [Venturia canescens]XP_043277909.1 uncharacterized protein LOC122412453 isoform X2 [Venturia canescens]XP_043277920.1 uncharacterized protein LOC122412453 isoform X2 [Venturia canescens]
MTSNKTTTKDKEREFLLECIELYRDLPALWQIKNKLYRDRDQKNMAYDLLLTKYKEMFPQATKEDLKKKFNSLRTNYRKELKKYLNSMKSGGSTDLLYKPTLWYFQEMNFLQDQKLPLDSESFMDTIAIADGNEDNEEQGSETQSSINDIQDSKPSRILTHTKNTHASKRPKKSEQLINLAYERLSEVKDEYHYWGMAWAAEFRKMERTQQYFAKKAIGEIILEGQLGLLHRDSVQIKKPPKFP